MAQQQQQQLAPWREKHRPKRLTDLIGLRTLKQDIASWKHTGAWPAAILYYGPPGTGKTTAAGVVAREMFTTGGDLTSHVDYYETNASHDRGIDFVRDTVKQIAALTPMTERRKVIFMDEADGLTKPAQEALRRTMEKYSDRTLFILTANNVTNVIPALQSRCTKYEFVPYTQGDYADFMADLFNKEQFPSEWCEEYALLHSATNGDLRQAIDLLQTTARDEYALHERLVGMSRNLAGPALSVASGDFDSLRAEMKRAATAGATPLVMLRNLHHHARTLGMSAEQFTSYSVVWGAFVEKATTWPLDSEGFIDYFVASLQAAHNATERKPQQTGE